MHSSRQLAVALPFAALVGCVSEPVTETGRAPAEVGSNFSIGGFQLVKPKENYGYEGTLSPSEQALREQAEKFDKTVWQGLLIGAIAGTAIGAVVGGDAESAVGGAIVGASVGALAGMYVANKQKLYASKEDQLNSMIGDVKTSNQNTEALIRDIRAVIAEDQRRLADIQARYHRGKATEAEVTQERARIWGNRKVAEKATLGAKDQYQLFDGAKQDFERQNPGLATQNLARELSAYRKAIDTLDSVASGMVKA